eukprot:2669464-Prymnesium_polylepis.1
MLLIAVVLPALAPSVIGGRHAASPAARAHSAMLLERRLCFDELDERRFLTYLGGLPNFALRWGEAEWRECGGALLQYSARPLRGDEPGIRLVYYLDEQTARREGRGGLVEDGGLDIVLVARAPRLLAAPGPAVVFRPDRGRGGAAGQRRAGEDVIFDRLLVDCLSGRASGCKLAGGYRLPSRARAFARIESACLYDKNVRKRF